MQEKITFKNSYRCWLFNPDWLVSLSIAFKSKYGPRVMVCRDHDNGCPKMMVNLPQQPSHNLPSKRSDQLSHVIIQPRSIKTVRVATYSTSFQMHEQRGSFSGIDTCSITNVGKFDFTSILLGESEARSIICRPEINALLNNLVQEKKFPCVLQIQKGKWQKR